LRRLEEFRKNPHVKILPNSPCANFQSLGKFKNLIFNSKIIFLHFRPGQPYGPLGLWPSRPRCHGMAYFIFLKYLRRLEEFRKNPHVKIPPKSPFANFQILDKFKNTIFNSKILFLRFRPSQSYGPLGLWRSQARWPLSSCGPKPHLPAHLARASVASSRKYVFPFCLCLPS
jgi:hypothetical protein